jgi:hypothetical protein
VIKNIVWIQEEIPRRFTSEEVVLKLIKEHSEETKEKRSRCVRKLDHLHYQSQSKRRKNNLELNSSSKKKEEPSNKRLL